MGKFTDYKVLLRGMQPGEHEFDFHLGAKFFADMESADVRDADLNVKLIVNCLGDRYDLNFHITGEVVTLCDRCLDDLHLPIDATYHVLVEYGDDYNSDSDDLLIIPGSDADLNVAYMIYDTVVLAIPMKHVHPMGKCNRQMTAMLRKHRTRPHDEDAEMENALIEEIDNIDQTSEEGNTDPRWDALKNINTDDN